MSATSFRQSEALERVQVIGDHPVNVSRAEIALAAPPDATYAWVVSGSRTEPDDVTYYTSEASSENDDGARALKRLRFHSTKRRK
jgi:hypothetical protein